MFLKEGSHLGKFHHMHQRIERILLSRWCLGAWVCFVSGYFWGLVGRETKRTPQIVEVRLLCMDESHLAPLQKANEVNTNKRYGFSHGFKVVRNGNRPSAVCSDSACHISWLIRFAGKKHLRVRQLDAPAERGLGSSKQK